MVLLLDEETDRIRDRVRTEYERHVEAVRAGTIYASNANAYRKWARRQARKQKPLSDAALVNAIHRIAAIFPDNVQFRTA